MKDGAVHFRGEVERRCSTVGGSNNGERSEQTERLREAFTGVKGAGPLARVARGEKKRENFVYCKLNRQYFRPFLV